LQSARAFETSVRLSASTPSSTDIATTRPWPVHSRALTLTLILEVLRYRGSQIPWHEDVRSLDPRSMVRAPWKGWAELRPEYWECETPDMISISPIH
jgi:hypothetical protein